MPDRLPWPGVAHRGGEGRDDDAVAGVIAVDEDLVGLHAGRGGHVVRLGLADERVDEEAVDGLQGGLGEVLVRPVDRVSGLEPDDPLPAALGEERPGVARGPCAARGRTALPFEDGHGSGGVVIRLAVEARDAGMGVVRGAKALLRLRSLS